MHTAGGESCDQIFTAYLLAVRQIRCKSLIIPKNIVTFPSKLFFFSLFFFISLGHKKRQCRRHSRANTDMKYEFAEWRMNKR